MYLGYKKGDCGLSDTTVKPLPHHRQERKCFIVWRTSKVKESKYHPQSWQQCDTHAMQRDENNLKFGGFIYQYYLKGKFGTPDYIKILI